MSLGLELVAACGISNTLTHLLLQETAPSTSRRQKPHQASRLPQLGGDSLHLQAIQRSLTGSSEELQRYKRDGTYEMVLTRRYMLVQLDGTVSRQHACRYQRDMYVRIGTYRVP